MLTHRKGDNETETKKISKEETSLLSLWVTGSRESSQGAPGREGHGLAFSNDAEGTC